MIRTSSESASTSSTAASPTAISPFSNYSANSGDATSDEIPDLGAFHTLFRTYRELHAPRPFAIPSHTIPSSETASTPATDTLNSSIASYEPQSESASALASDPPGSTVWNQHRIASYLNPTSSLDTDQETNDAGGRELILSPASSDNEDCETDDDLDRDTSTAGEPVEIHYEESAGSRSPSEGLVEPDPSRASEKESELDVTGEFINPSLGYLDGVLSFLAAERARAELARSREPMAAQSKERQPNSAVEPRRRRRRRRQRSASLRGRDEDIEEEGTNADADAEIDSSSSDPQSSARLRNRSYKSTPATPRRPRRNTNSSTHTTLSTNPNNPYRSQVHSQSTPSLLAHAPVPTSALSNPRVISLRKLAHQLRMMFPADAARLTHVLKSEGLGDAGDVFDPRGPVPTPYDPMVHVFIDHSNILIGFLTHLKRHRHPAFSASKTKPKLKHISHTALALILERGRPITRRVLVASSPLYQPMDMAERLGYEVRVYKRVPDEGNGADREKRNAIEGGGAAGGGEFMPGHRRGQSSNGGEGKGRGKLKKGHGRKLSNTNGSADSEGDGGANGSGNAAGFSQSFMRSLGVGSSSSRPTSNTTSGANASTSTSTPTRIRYREQGVDELLQLKLHQAIAATDPPPPGSTIVLATGDGNIGQFNDDGFLGTVRTALKKGWTVELYAWEEGLSRAWRREFGDAGRDAEGQARWGGRFRIIKMEDFAVDLLEMGPSGGTSE